ncbi:thioredoxin family protein [Microbispora triticiradicis]|uniref:Thioredoxin family protein n=2 Tax=Microbispora TaxID=2005 RepID=A0ABY3LSV7_9ACTN|nr:MULTISPECIES: thioredoxin family protein [Microbispora]TLP62467.1 thioredoxin family protein [Microbispora fusca]TYB52026.1 thioredoxin family protein [Microbispora tritici]
MAGIATRVDTLVLNVAAGPVPGRRDGRVRAVEHAPAARGDLGSVLAADLGADLGERATLVQFSTAFCQPCRATRRILGEVASLVPGVRHVEIDAESRLDLVRRFEVLSTPTVLVLDGAGNVVKRASGQPRKADVIAALGFAVDGTSHHSSQPSDKV